MSVERRIFGELKGREIYSFILDNGNGLSAEILNYGGIIRKLVYKGTDVCLGYDSLDEYISNNEYFGALIGRNANRIEDAEFKLNGEVYKLSKNAGNDNLHGGGAGFDRKIWNYEIPEGDEPSIVFSLFSPDGDEGFPGVVYVTVTYTLTSDNSLKIYYSGESGADTVLNMTNHTYFNLNGHSDGSVKDCLLWLDSDFYTPNNDKGIPTGEILSVRGTPLDFTSELMSKLRLDDGYEQIRMFGGIDHNFALNGNGYRRAGMAKGDKTGISMEIYTDQKGMQIYTANEIEGEMAGKEGALYTVHSGICFETQAFPNSLKFSHFPGSVLKKGDKYETTTSYRFI